MPFDVRVLRSKDRNLLQQVVELGDQNKAQLGLLPASVIGEYAAAGSIIVAVHESVVYGYLLFRNVPTKSRASIVHLCVDTQHRGEGVADSLFRQMRKLTAGLNGVSLNCRRDFEHPSRLWERLGFVPVDERPGRGQQDSILTVWWFDYKSSNLFSEYRSNRVDVVMDANIFYDICETTLYPLADVLALKADWLAEEIRLVITDELLNEIGRNKNKERRTASRQLARAYTTVGYDKEERDAILEHLIALYQREPTDRNMSDLRHVANVIASGCSYFVTHDGGILAKAEEVRDEYGVHLMRPVELISNIDQLSNSHKYQPQWMGSHNLENRLVKGPEVDGLARVFAHPRSEKLLAFRHRLRAFAAKTDCYQCHVVEDTSISYPHCLVVSRPFAHGVDVELLRAGRRPLSSRLLERQVKWLILNQAKSGFGVVSISDPMLVEGVIDLLPEYGFWRHPASATTWYKYTAAGALTLEEVQQHVAHLDQALFAEDPSPLARQVAQVERGDLNALTDLERTLWPAKVKELQIPCYIVSVQPRWARYLFDERQSEADMFGFNTELLFSRRNVYYSAAKTAFHTPARILWYVSTNKGATVSALRATSYLDRVAGGSLKEVFDKYEELGAFKWDDIKELGTGKTNSHIQALEFSDTETFDRSVSHTEVVQAFAVAGRTAPPFLGPVSISPDLFLVLYARSRPTFAP